VCGSPRRGGQGKSASADFGRLGRGPGGPLPEAPLAGIPARARLLPVRPPGGNGRAEIRRGARGGAARRGGRHGPRPRARRGSRPAKPGDRRPVVLRRPGNRGPPRAGLRRGSCVAWDPGRREALPGPRGLHHRLPLRSARRPGGPEDSPRTEPAAVPARDPRGDPGDHDGARGLPRARPGASRHAVPEDPYGTAARLDAVPGDDRVGRARNEGDLGAARDGRGCVPGRLGGVRRGAFVPRGEPPGRGDRTTREGIPRRRYIPSPSVGGGPEDGSASGGGGGEDASSSGCGNRRTGASPAETGGASAGTLGM